MPRRHRFACALLFLATAFAWATEKGSFGFAIEVDADSFSFNPTLRSVKVASVVPGSAATRSGLQAGDQILEVQGIVVAGARANDFKSFFQDRAVGDTVKLKIQHAGGAPVETTLTAAPRP